jgi:hypothetical protein
MELQQMIELLLKEIRAIHAKVDADRKKDQEDFLARWDANRKAWREDIRSMRFETSIARKETMACQETEARPEEEKMPTLVDRKPEAAKQREAPVDDAKVMPVGEPKKKRRRDRQLAVEHRRQKTNTSTRDNCGPQKSLAVARSGLSRRGRVTRHMKETDRKMPRRATVARRMRDISRPNMTCRAAVAWRKRNLRPKEMVDCRKK